MERNHLYSRVVREAANRLGSHGQLASLLGVSHDQLMRWSTGVEEPPLDVFLAGLDLIADGQLGAARKARRAP